jgi:type VI secretion system protein ImpM
MNMAEHLLGAPTVGWYGKIPAAGDFVTRQLSYSLTRAWERWMLNGLTALQHISEDMLARHYAVAPVWNFLIPAGLGFDCVQLGALAPSCDRVGRYFPVAAMLPVPLREFDAACLEHAGPFYRQVGETILAAVRHGYSPEQLDKMLLAGSAGWAARPPQVDANDILAVLATGKPGDQGLAWPGLSLYFESAGVTSFWWTNQSDGSPLQTHVHTGETTNALFARLFGPQQGYLL